MLPSHPNLSTSVLTVSPPDSKFTPRKEFIRAGNHVSSSFALLTIAGAGLVRVSSFPQDVVTALQRSFDHNNLLREYREDHHLHLTEFILERKPWAAYNSATSEKIFVRILAVIFHHGYSILSTLDRARDHDERLCIAFSRPDASMPPPKVPFVVSFPSSRVLRVVSPPLQSTPAILQSVRAAWSSGKTRKQVTEKKVLEDCYEFKLKGFSWLPNGNAPVASVELVQSLLNYLDTHAFSLVTSLNLFGGRSRTKDLWIFVGIAEDVGSFSTASLGSRADSPHICTPISPTAPDNPFSSRPKQQDDPGSRYLSPPGIPRPSEHTRASSNTRNSYRQSFPPPWRQPSTLHKDAAISTDSSAESHIDEEYTGLQQKPSSSVGSVDMTGIGTLGKHNSMDIGRYSAVAPDAGPVVAPILFSPNNDQAAQDNEHLQQRIAEAAQDRLSWSPEILRDVAQNNRQSLPETSRYPQGDQHEDNRLSVNSPPTITSASSRTSRTLPIPPAEAVREWHAPLGPQAAAHLLALPAQSFRDSGYSNATTQFNDQNRLSVEKRTRFGETLPVEYSRQTTSDNRWEHSVKVPFPSTSRTDVSNAISDHEGTGTTEEIPGRELRRSLPTEKRYSGRREHSLSNAAAGSRRQLSPVEEKTLQEAMAPSSPRPQPSQLVIGHPGYDEDVEKSRRVDERAANQPSYDPYAPDIEPSAPWKSHAEFPRHQVRIASPYVMKAQSQPHMRKDDSLYVRKQEKANSEPSASTPITGGLGGGWVLVNFTASAPPPSGTKSQGKVKPPRSHDYGYPSNGNRSHGKAGQPPSPTTIKTPWKQKIFKSKSKDALTAGKAKR